MVKLKLVDPKSTLYYSAPKGIKLEPLGSFLIDLKLARDLLYFWSQDLGFMEYEQL